jgi:hypothetical protein
MSSESSTDTRYIDKLATDLTRADIRAKCATAAEHNGRKYFGIYNGNICKFGTTLENEFFYTKNLKSFDSSSCFRDSSGNVDIFELHADNPSGSNTATKAQRSAMTSTYITEVTATGDANTNLKLDGTRVWSVYVRATGIVDMSNIGVKSGPIESRGNRRFPNGFSIESGTDQALSCHTITNHTKLKCYVPAGLGTDFNVWSTLGGQSSNNINIKGYAAPLIESISSTTNTINVGNNMPTRGNTMISINGKNFGNGEIGSIFTGEIIYSANQTH